MAPDVDVFWCAAGRTRALTGEGPERNLVLCWVLQQLGLRLNGQRLKSCWTHWLVHFSEIDTLIIQSLLSGMVKIIPICWWISNCHQRSSKFYQISTDVHQTFIYFIFFPQFHQYVHPLFIQFQGIFTIDVYPIISCFRPTSSIIPPWARQGPSSFWSFGAEGHQRHSSTWRGSICPLGCWKLGSRGLVSPGGRQNMAKNGGSFLPPKIENQLGDVDVFSRMMLVAKSGSRRAGMSFLMLFDHTWKWLQNVPENSWRNSGKFQETSVRFFLNWVQVGAPGAAIQPQSQLATLKAGRSTQWGTWKFQCFFFFPKSTPMQIRYWIDKPRTRCPVVSFRVVTRFRFLFPHLPGEGLKTLSDFLPSFRASVLPCVRPSFLPSPNSKLHIAVPTEIWRSRLRSGSAHWDLKLAVEICVMQRDDMCAESASVDQSRVVFPVLSKLFAMETCYDPKWCHPCLAACCLHFQIRTAGQCCTSPPGFPEVWREHGAGLGLIWKVLVCYVLSYDHVIQRNFYSSQLRSEAAGGEGEEGRRKEEEATLIKSTNPRQEKNVRIDARKIQK